MRSQNRITAGGSESTAGAAQAAPPTKPAEPASKIKPELLSKLEGKDAKEATDYWVRFTAKADLTKASAISDWNARGTAVAAALRKTAADSQAGVKAALDAQHVNYQTFWATNAIRINGGSLALAQNLAQHTEVEGLYNPTAIEVPKVTRARTSGRSTRSSGAWPTSTPTTSGRSTATRARASSSPTSTPGSSTTTRRW